MSIYQADTQAAVLPGINKRLAETIFVAFDTETTGLSPVVARLVEISGVKFAGDGRVLSTFQSLINPERAIPPEATAVHGITDDMVASAPTCEDVIPPFIEWATHGRLNEEEESRSTILVAHNAPFDISFLEVAMAKLSMPFPENIILDTLPLARHLIPESPNYQLRTLVEHLGIGAESYHRALADSHHVRNVMLHLIERQGAEAEVEDFVQIAGRLHFMDRAQSDSYWAQNAELQLIKRAIADGNDLRIFYSGIRKADRLVTPKAVLFAGGTAYLNAFCHMASAERTFRVDRIVKMEARVGQQ